MVSWVNPEAMSLVKAKRLKTIDHEGTEVTSESVSGYERWTLFQKANVTAQVASGNTAQHAYLLEICIQGWQPRSCNQL